jgi:hydroxyacylglutathione hydrolase
MKPEITINLGGVNCYLLRAGEDFVLIDTGFANKRAVLERKLAEAGCRPGNIRLILITHGDMDHAGNGAYLREKYGAKIGMHAADAGMAEGGDMSLNRKARPDRMSLIFKIMSAMTPLFFKPGKFEVFKPELIVDESFDLTAYGLDAGVLHLPGHSKGSIGVLTAGGDLFCGDFLYNMRGFGFIDDLADHRASLEKVKKLNIQTIFPGHGKPFSADRLRRTYE